MAKRDKKFIEAAKARKKLRRKQKKVLLNTRLNMVREQARVSYQNKMDAYYKSKDPKVMIEDFQRKVIEINDGKALFADLLEYVRVLTEDLAKKHESIDKDSIKCYFKDYETFLQNTEELNAVTARISYEEDVGRKFNYVLDSQGILAKATAAVSKLAFDLSDLKDRLTKFKEGKISIEELDLSNGDDYLDYIDPNTVMQEAQVENQATTELIQQIEEEDAAKPESIEPVVFPEASVEVVSTSPYAYKCEDHGVEETKS